MQKWKTFTVKINIWWSNQYREAIVQMFFKIGVLQNSSNFTRKHLRRSLFSNVAGLRACNFVKKRLEHRCFPVKFAKFLRTRPVAAYEFCSGGCIRIVSVSKYMIISNQCIKVNIWSIAWCCIHPWCCIHYKIIPQLDS